MIKTCRICRRPMATQEIHDAAADGDRMSHLCWREWYLMTEDSDCHDIENALREAALDMRDALESVLEWTDLADPMGGKLRKVIQALAKAKGEES